MDPILDSLIDRIRAAAEAGTALRIRGGGSKDFYGERLQGELLETTALAGITSYEPTELVVTARAGTPLDVVYHELGHAIDFKYGLWDYLTDIPGNSRAAIEARKTIHSELRTFGASFGCRVKAGTYISRPQ